MKSVSLKSFLESEERGFIDEYLSSFTCKANNSVEEFLHFHAVKNEERGFSRTTLVIDEVNNYEIIGYFTILVKNFDFIDVSGTIRKRLTGNKKSTSFITVLIAQLGRSDAYKGKVSGCEILDIAIENCTLINELSSIKVACVEFEDNKFLRDFYEENEFKILQKSDNGYLIAYIRL